MPETNWLKVKAVLRVLCSAAVGLLLLHSTSGAQISKIEGYDGYTFGMTLEQAKLVKRDARVIHCNYPSDPNVSTCIEYQTTISAFTASVAVQFAGAPLRVKQILRHAEAINTALGEIRYTAEQARMGGAA